MVDATVYSTLQVIFIGLNVFVMATWVMNLGVVLVKKDGTCVNSEFNWRVLMTITTMISIGGFLIKG